MRQYFVYIILCQDQSLYTGITTDLERRFHQHRTGRGARYTRSRGVQAIVYQEGPLPHSEAAQREYALKKLTRPQKEALIASAPHHASLSDGTKLP